MAKLKMTELLSSGLTARFDNQEEDCDVIFEIEGKCIKAHKLVLAVQCQVLDDLSQGWTSDMNPILIDVIDYQSFKAFLR